MLQPIGRTLAIDVTPTVGFYPLETVINGQVAMPNHIKINGKDNNGLVQLVLNDALLRTADDRVFLDIDNRDGEAFDLALYIGTREAAKLAYAAEPLESHLPRVVRQQVGAGAVMVLVLSQIDGHFIAELDGSNMGNSNEDDSSSGNNASSSDNSGIIWDELVNCTEENYLHIWDGNGLHSGGYAVKLKSDVRTFGFYCLPSDQRSFTLELVPADYKMNGDPIVPADKRNLLITFYPDFITIWDSYTQREIQLPMVYKVGATIAVQLETNRVKISNLDNHQQMIFSGNFGNDAAVFRAIPHDGTIGNVAIEPITDPAVFDFVFDFTPNVVYEQ